MEDYEAIVELLDIKRQKDNDILRLKHQRMKQTVRDQLTKSYRTEQDAIDIAIKAIKDRARLYATLEEIALSVRKDTNALYARAVLDNLGLPVGG